MSSEYSIATWIFENCCDQFCSYMWPNLVGMTMEDALTHSILMRMSEPYNLVTESGKVGEVDIDT